MKKQTKNPEIFTKEKPELQLEFTDLKCGLVKCIVMDYAYNGECLRFDDEKIIAEEIQKRLDSFLKFKTEVSLSIDGMEIGFSGKVAVFEEGGNNQVVNFTFIPTGAEFRCKDSSNITVPEDFDDN